MGEDQEEGGLQIGVQVKNSVPDGVVVIDDV
jgi:hypothetical protein